MAVKRLYGISFLGILSPRYAEIARTPIYKRATVQKNGGEGDGSRADHSIGVAELAVQVCRALRLNEEQQKYAAAWGLLHDLGNWPLSHTAQQAFSELLGVSPKAVREWLVTNDSRAPKQYFVAAELEACGLDPERMMLLFSKKPDKALVPVSEIIQSKLTPDMLEGIWRSGVSFGVRKFKPVDFISAWYHDLADDFVMHQDFLPDAILFWKTKREIYSRFFASKSAVHFESCWSSAIHEYFQNSGITLEQSLELSEDWLVQEIAGRVSRGQSSISRWKPPIRQRIRKLNPGALTLKAFDDMFVEESIPIDDYK